MRVKKIIFILIVFISIFFYGSSKETESIHSISSRKTAELNLKITKKKSKEESMYIDRENKKIFYFFDNDGLVRNDFVNVTEKLSLQEGKSKSFSKRINNLSEYKISNKNENENIEFIAEKGNIKNRVIINYKNEPQNLYIEFYEGTGKLKKVIKNRYVDLNTKKIYGKLNNGAQEIEIKFRKNNSILEEILSDSEKIEIIGVSPLGEVKLLEHEILDIQQFKTNVEGSLKIKLKNLDDRLYIISYDSLSKIKDVFLLEVEKDSLVNIFNKSNEVFMEFFKWNSSLVDITEWSRKNFKLRNQNRDFYYGEEEYLGEIIPYVDINMGEIIIPIADPSIVGDSIELKNHNDIINRGKLLLKNKNGQFIEGVMYFKTDLEIEISEIKGKNNLPIEGATSKIYYKGLREKRADIRLRIYDRKMGEESIFVEGITEYINNRISDNTIEIKYNGNILYTDNTMPKVEFVDTRDSLKANLVTNKRVLDFTYDIGKNVGKDLNWALANRFVDVRLAEVIVNNFEDKVEKLKEPYLEIETQNDTSTSYLEVNGERINPYRYYIRLENGRGLDENKVTEGDFILGYNKISTTIENGKINDLKGDVIVRLLVADYLKIKNSNTSSLNFKNNDGSAPKIKLVLNSDYPDRAYDVNLESYNLLTMEDDKVEKEVDLKVLLALREIKENKLNLVFDVQNNTSGDIALRGDGQHIENGLGRLNGLSVFDMRGEPISQTYDEDDILSVESEAGMTVMGDVGAKFEVDGYKGIKVKQATTNIEYEIRFWNNTKKIEIVMNKANYTGNGSIESSGIIKIIGSNGKTKLKLNLNLSASQIDLESNYILMRGSTNLYTELIITRPFVYSANWNANVSELTEGRLTGGVDLVIDNFKTFTGDKIVLQSRDGVNEHGLIKENFTLKPSTTSTIGTIENGRAIFNSNGSVRVKVEATLTQAQRDNIWKESADQRVPKLNVMELVFGYGKRRIPQWIQLRDNSGGSLDAYVNLESEVIDSNQPLKIGNYLLGTQTGEIYDEENILYLNIGTGTDVGDYSSLESRMFRGKDINLRFVSIGGQQTKTINMYLDDIVLSKVNEEFGIFRLVRPDNAGQERNIHKIIIPKYNPIDEAYSPLSSLQTSIDGNSRLLTEKLEIVRDRLDDVTSTLGIVKNLGTVGLLGRDGLRKNIIDRNSTTMNYIKLPNRVILQKSKNGVEKSEVKAELSFSATDINEKEFLQIAELDQEKQIYLHIVKVEAEKLEPGAIYSLIVEYDAGRIEEGAVVGRNIAYIGLKTDNIDDLGLNEYIYDPLFQLNLQTEIAQDTSVKLYLSDDKPLIKSDGSSNLVRVYLSEAKYSIDISNPEDYSTLSMRGLLTPYEHDKVEYGNVHNMVVTDLISGNKATVPLDSSIGGQGILKTVSGDIYIGYLNNPNLQIGTVAGNPLEILTIGMKKYNFRGGSLQIEIEHQDPNNQVNILTKESFSLEIPRFLPKRWYYNIEDSYQMEEEATGSVRYVNGNEIIYPLGNVSLYGDRDLELTKDESDTLGVRIEYDENIELENKEDSSNKIQGRIVRIDNSGNILSKDSIYTTVTKLAIVIDTRQAGYSNGSSYIYRGGSVDEIGPSVTNKLIRIGREGHWEGLVRSIELKRISQGELTLNYDFNYKRGREIEFDGMGRLISGSGAYINIKGEFIKNIPEIGKVSVFKYVSEDNLYGEKLGEVNIIGGRLESPLEVSYKNGIETTYFIVFNKIANDVLSTTLNYWKEGIFNDKIVIRVEDKNGITAIYRMNLRDFDNKSVLTIEYDNSQIGSGVLPDELVNSLYFGSILNPNSFNYNDQRGRVESLNKLKVTYYGKDLNIHDTIGRVEVVDKDIVFKDDFDNEIVIEDTSIHRVYKRELLNSQGDILYEEGFKLRGYFNPRTNVRAIDGRYRGTLRVNVEIY